jgi:hypothetical protein
MSIKNKGFDLDGFLDDLADSIQDEFGASTEEFNIVDFVENQIDKLSWGVKELNPRQWVLLKTFYSLPLSDDEISILEAWYALDRTSLNPISNYPPQQPFQALIVEAGRRGSKSFTASIIVAFEFCRLCLMKSPQLYYGIATSTPISIYCIATSATQTKRTIFAQAKALLEHIPAIKRLVDRKKVIIGEEEIKYPDKLLYIYSGNSNSASQVGSSVICLVMDEVARFDDEGKDNDESNALQLWSNIGISGVTFGKDAKRIAISSAWCDGDAIQKLYSLTKESPGTLGFRLRSWDLNPVHAARDNPVVQSEYLLDPRKAALEFEGIRFNKAYSFFTDDDIQKAFRGSTSISVSKLKSPDSIVRLQIDDILPTINGSVMHLDPAFVRDSYAIAFGHRETIKGDRFAIIDGLLVWEPDVNQQVGITNIYKCIYEIHNRRPLSKITSDHYNPETVQHLRNNGLNASVITFSQGKQLELYDFFRKMLHEERVILPNNSPWSSKLKDELFGIQLIKGKKIDHRRDGSKDIADACVAVVWHLMSDFNLTATPVSNSVKPTQPIPFKDDLADLGFSSAKELVTQVKRSYSKWDSKYLSEPSWLSDDI